jgi:hypothetical protein
LLVVVAAVVAVVMVVLVLLQLAAVVVVVLEQVLVGLEVIVITTLEYQQMVPLEQIPLAVLEDLVAMLVIQADVNPVLFRPGETAEPAVVMVVAGLPASLVGAPL